MKIINFLIFLFLIILQLISSNNAKECKSVYVIQHLEHFDRLVNCTVIKGHLSIGLIRRHKADPNVFNNMSFPELREITDYMFLYMVEGLKSLKTLFPNLTVIRGRKLNLRYAFAINDCPDIEEIGLESLISIQRGQVFIDSNQNLCYSDKVAWKNVTQHPERNYIGHNTNYPEKCPPCPPGCTNCWGKNSCQHYDLENLVNPTYYYCHPQCLGGCWSDKSCVTCRNFVQNTTCVLKCSSDRYASYDDMRCYTKPECLALNKIIFNQDNRRECVDQCPSGFASEYKSKGQRYSLINCARCHILDSYCGKKVCEGDNIEHFEHLEYFKDCVRINGSLSISLRDPTSVKDLYTYLGSIEEISGYLRIHLSNHITTLKFFANLKLIRGWELKDGYSLLIHHNKNLTQLWDWQNQNSISLTNGGIYAHSNYKLCNYRLKEMENNIHVIDKKFNHIYYNDDEILCGNAFGIIDYKVLSHTAISINWAKEKVYDNLIVLYREFDKNTNLTLHSDIDEDVCLRNSWYRENIPHDPRLLKDNKMFVNYNITNLKPNTVYAVVIKTFNNFKDLNSYEESQSPLTYIKTEPDLETPPRINITSTDPNKITFNWDHYEFKSDFEDLLIEIFADYDDAKTLRTKDFVNTDYPYYTTDSKGIILTGNHLQECTEVQFEEFEEEDEFYEIIKKKFYCNLNSPNKCENQMPLLNMNTKATQMVLRTSPGQKKSITVEKLKHYTNYIIKVSSCTKQICGSYYLDSIRTPPIEEKDHITEVNVTAGWRHYQYYVRFVPPKDPNGLIIFYAVEVAKSEKDLNSEDYTFDPNEFDEAMKYKGVEIRTTPDCLVRVKVLTLGTYSATSWYKVPPPGSTLTLEIIIAIMVLISLAAFGMYIYKYRMRIVRYFRPPREEQQVTYRAGEEQNILLQRNDESISIDDGSDPR